MKQYSIQQYKTVKHDIIPDIIIDEENETQEEVEKEITFVQSSHNINNLTSLFVNNELKTLGEDYSIEDDRVIFTDVLNDTDKISLIYNINTESNLISPKKNVNNSILSKYDSDARLASNNKYTINICIDKDNYTWSFNTKQNPMFSSSKKILEDIGEFIDGFTEEYINNVIYDNSVAVIDLIDELKEQDIENVTYSKDKDGFYVADNRAINNWVRYKTDIDLTLSRYFGISYKYGSELKEIGDIKIEKSTKLPYIDNLLDMLKKKFELADDAIRGGENTVLGAVKGGSKYKYDDWARDTKW